MPSDQRMISFVDLAAQQADLKELLDSRIAAVLSHGQYILGPEVAELEQALSRRTGTRHCVSVGSGTDALLISLMALGVGPGDEVIIPAFTFAATAEVVLLVGATPVLVDIESDTSNVDVAAVKEAVTDCTRVIMPVSLYGQPADMDEIVAFAEERGLVVVEDAAQSFGAQYRGRESCALSSIGCTSFFPSKPLGCYGDGGALFTDDDEIAQAAREIRVHGQSRRYHHSRIGIGGRMDTLQCAILLAKLKRFDWEIERRQEIGRRYNEAFDKLNVERVAQRPDRTSIHAQYAIFVDRRDEVQRALNDAGIPTAIHYPSPLSDQPAFRDRCRFGDLPKSWEAARRVLCLPMHPYLDETVQDRILDAVADAIDGNYR